MVNVEYIHKVIEQQWDISIPYNPKLENPKFAANMKYLLTAVDVANEMLNGQKTTDYGNGEYATLYAADTVATNDAVARLVKKDIDFTPKFFITTTPDTSSFSFSMSAKGKFLVDWGDGQTETITRNNTTEKPYSHDYATAGEYKISIGGWASKYSTNNYTATISFRENTNVAGIDGSLGAVFGTIGDGSAPGQQPRFYSTFAYCSNLSGGIPPDLFVGVHGAPTVNMFGSLFYYCGGLSGGIPEQLFAEIKGDTVYGLFHGTFKGCRGLSGKIPSGLFAGVRGAPKERLFYETFTWCDGLSGSIPADLFAGIQGPPAKELFVYTFGWCSGLSGGIPSGLFAGISGAPANGMFLGTFVGCTALTEIPSDLFGDISGPAQDFMFDRTFYNCDNLTGPSAKIGDKYLYEIWPDATGIQVKECYYNATGLSDYDDIPSDWK